MPKRSICFVLEYYYPHIGGVEKLFYSLTTQLARLGYKVRVVTLALPETNDCESINGVEVLRVKVPPFASRYFFSFIAFFYLLIFVRDFDLIHTTTFNAALPAWMAAKVLRKRIVITVHEVWGKAWLKIPSVNLVTALTHNFYERLIMQFTYDGYICVSKHTKNCLKAFGIDSQKMKVIYNGLDENFWNPRRWSLNGIRNLRWRLGLKQSFVYLFFGRPGISKGVEFLLRAVPEISRKIPSSNLLMILSPTPSYRYRYVCKLIRDLKIEDRIFLMQTVPEDQLPLYICLSDCVVVPSLREGFGFSALEACYLGVPLVATTAGSLPEVVSGKHLLVDPASPEALVQGVCAVFQGKYQTSALKRFPLGRTVQQYISMYDELFV